MGNTFFIHTIYSACTVSKSHMKTAPYEKSSLRFLNSVYSRPHSLKQYPSCHLQTGISILQINANIRRERPLLYSPLQEKQLFPFLWLNAKINSFFLIDSTSDSTRPTPDTLTLLYCLVHISTFTVNMLSKTFFLVRTLLLLKQFVPSNLWTQIRNGS